MSFNSDDWKGLLKKVAPTIATAFGGPAAGMAASAIGQMFLGNPKATEKDISEFILSASPETMLKLKELEKQFVIDMEKLGIDVYRIDAEDRKSARDRETKLGWVGSAGIYSLAFLIVGGFMAAGYQIFKGSLPQDPNQLVLLGTVIGYLSSKTDQIISYFFGSSKGSKDKTEAMSKAMQDVVNKR